jgi:hypothetical protein
VACQGDSSLSETLILQRLPKGWFGSVRVLHVKRNKAHGFVERQF